MRQQRGRVRQRGQDDLFLPDFFLPKKVLSVFRCHSSLKAFLTNFSHYSIFDLYFTDFGFEDGLMDGIDSMGYETATPVQEQVIPLVLDGRDVIAAAQTGTGKTAAFLLPVIQKLLTQQHVHHKINALILVPTRELAVQIAQIMEGISYFTDISSLAVYGGSDGGLFANERKALSTGVDMVICTPGRMIAHMKMGYVKLDAVKYLVLDEADRMLDMGFYEDIVKIIDALPKHRQNLLFSATMPPKIRSLAHNILVNPATVTIAISKPPEQIEQGVFFLFDAQKPMLVKHILSSHEGQNVLVFCSSKQSVKVLTADLKKSGFGADQIHSDLEQQQRENVLSDFKNKKLKVLVATDIISRGIDIDDIDLVINYDIPRDGEDYVHRIGRTARAASKGTAYTFITGKEQRKFAAIERLLGKPVPRMQLPPELGAAPEEKPLTEHNGKKKRFRKKK